MTGSPDILVITIPARASYLSICRLNVTAMAAAVGFDVDALDDLRLAVNEAVNWLLLGDSDRGTIELRIETRDHFVRFRGHRSVDGLMDRPIDDLAGAIFGATIDELEHGNDEKGFRFIELTKHVADG